MPGESSVPVIVYVFPEDVCPYANIVPLKPRVTASTIGFAISLYTSEVFVLVS